MIQWTIWASNKIPDKRHWRKRCRANRWACRVGNLTHGWAGRLLLRT